LRDALDVYGDRQIAIANDLTKMFEAVWRGKISELITRLENEDLRGEFTVVIAGAEAKTASKRAVDTMITAVK
jgi:16S rRNA (cytidine1402-2'-O)-methyltransferase